MNIDLVNRIKRIAIIALASDDELVESLVLKGGNAIDLEVIRQSNKLTRASYDLDYSISDGTFSEDDDEISARIERSLIQTFLEHGFKIFDYKFLPKPKIIKDELAAFWGGYNVQFKVMDIESFEKANNIGELRRKAIALNPNHSPNFVIEFSKYEFVGDKKKVDVDGYGIYIYTAEMIAFEKLRAICQQMPEYKQVVPQFTPRARARDFYDIHLIMEAHEIDLHLPENIALIQNIFEAKKVPLNFIQLIEKNADIHREDWKSVLSTVSADDEIEDFDYYLKYVLNKVDKLTFP